MSGGKKTIMPADVFRALDDVEYGFMREKLEAEFASQYISSSFILCSSILFSLPFGNFSSFFFLACSFYTRG